VVWADRDLELTTCPVLAFTPEVREINRWFDACHRLAVTPAGVLWERYALPGPGGVGDQDHRRLAALDLLLEQKNRLLLRGAPAKDAELTAFHTQERKTQGLE
jgi:hypothetical protein